MDCIKNLVKDRLDSIPSSLSSCSNKLGVKIPFLFLLLL